jgi:hypothetical protein
MTTIKIGYEGKYFSELIKIKKFPKINKTPDKEIWCTGKDWRKFLNKNIELTCILNKIGNEIFGQEYDLYKDMYCAISFDGDFSSGVDKAYVYISGDGCLYIVDDMNKFYNGDGEKWLKSISSWKKLK